MSDHRFFDALAAWRYLLLVVLAAAAVAIVGSWRRGGAQPQDVGAHYEQGLAAYRGGDFRRAVDVLGRAYALDADDVGVNTLLGWSHWRLANVKQARFHFERALQRDRSSLEAQTGLGLTSLALDDLDTAIRLLERVAAAAPADRDVSLSLATAYVRRGLNRRAADVYRGMLRRDPADAAARRELRGMYGSPDGDDDTPVDLPPVDRPSAPHQWFRAAGDRLQAFDGERWSDVYLVGSNLGPARPGEFPSTVSRDYAAYAGWLREMAAMHANTVRVYTVLPPAFYRALADHNREAASPLWLIQEIWINDDARDLYDPRIEQEFVADLHHVIDLLHGRGDVPYRPGAQYGLYTEDVSRWVIGLAIGREIEPHLAQRTDARHAARTSHDGTFVSLPRGTPTEAWLARMCDRAVEYEMTTYNTQRPLTVVNWPPLDALAHPVEASFVEEIAQRQARGEPVSPDDFVMPDFTNDADVVSIDLTRFRPTAAFTGGLFALYHVYQHWPDFLFNEPAYARVRDREGPNRYLGYLQALKTVHRGMPLVIGEYGLATSLAPAHLHPDGWHNGGLSEREQAALLLRFTRNHHEAGAAGSLVFAWKDEWWKKVADQFTSDFEIPRDHDPRWFNVLDPEEAFGLVGYEPEFTVPLLRGRAEDWAGSVELSAAPAGAALRSVRAMADYAYLYVRIDVPPASIDWHRVHYWLALNTLPGESGSRSVPGVPLRMVTGANFLLRLDDPKIARLSIAENYWPNHRVPIPGARDEARIVRKAAYAATLAEASPFVEMVTEPNARRFGRGGVFFPAREYTRGLLRHGTADRASSVFDDQSSWHADGARGLIEIRIPWGLLLVTDPSTRQVLAGVDAEGKPWAKATSGVSVAALAVAAGDGNERRVLGSLPALDGHVFATPPPVYVWPTWTEVRFRQYSKRAYTALAPLFADLGNQRP